MDAIFDLLRSKGIFSRGRVSAEKIGALSKVKIIDLAETLRESTLAHPDGDQRRLFAHSASLSLGGGRVDCEGFDCRLRSLSETARFAALYSDRVYINNFFSDYIHLKVRDEDALREAFHEDLQLLSFLRPLLDRKLVVLLTPSEHICPRCLAYMSGDPVYRDKLHKVRRALWQEYLSNVEVTFSKDSKSYLVRQCGPTKLIEHGRLNSLWRELPDVVARNDRLMSKLIDGKTVALSKSTVKQLGFHRSWASEIIRNISYEVAASKALGTSLLTNKLRDLEILREVSDRDLLERNSIAFDHLSATVPYLEDVNILDVIKLREGEQESFLQFRSALHQAIQDVRATKGAFNVRDAKNLYCDKIAPAVAHLDRKVGEAKKRLRANARRSAIATVGTISAGLLGLASGFLSPELARMVVVLGGGVGVKDLLPKVMALGDSENEIRNDEFYFLWRVKRVSNRE